MGFVTDRDLALSVIADGRDFGDHVADHASSPAITAEPEMQVEEADGPKGATAQPSSSSTAAG